MIEGVLFDLDGTLTDLDTRLVNPFRQSFEQIMKEIPDDDVIANALEELLLQIGNKSKFRLVRIIWKIARNGGCSQLQSLQFLYLTLQNYNRSKFKFKVLENAEKNLRWAIDNYDKVGIVTSASKKAVEKAKEQVPILNEIEVFITDDDVKNPKPNPDPIILACKKLNLDPNNAIYIGDLSTDIMSGKGAGTKTLAVLGKYGKYTKALIKKERPDFIVENLTELLSTLKMINSQVHT